MYRASRRRRLSGSDDKLIRQNFPNHFIRKPAGLLAFLFLKKTDQAQTAQIIMKSNQSMIDQ
ncbi:hypothetical protein LHK_00776 [Laribacter hongkongensis HLHK9]|uniref:Uncharacterized protein n=1 Tax=Laribacter hongkongensis (strain HLHK9) TaxID=557598 RepID=C1D4H5_LARHH|nr:hypothetical protein LHK_00776 [Laribacter hongkongensis HLHK9]